MGPFLSTVLLYEFGLAQDSSEAHLQLSWVNLSEAYCIVARQDCSIITPFLKGALKDYYSVQLFQLSCLG